MTLLDTSVLIDGLSGPRRSAKALRLAIEKGERTQWFRDADLWTLNVADFKDVPQLRLAAF